MFGFKLPQDFLIGTGNSAFQSEGAWDRDGKTKSVMEDLMAQSMRLYLVMEWVDKCAKAHIKMLHFIIGIAFIS